MTYQPGKQTITINILTNISISKDKQTTKFGQLIEYNMRNTLLEKWNTNSVGETIARPFSFGRTETLSKEGTTQGDPQDLPHWYRIF